MSEAAEATADVARFVESGRAAVDAALERKLPSTDRQPGTLHRAMRYSALSGGKRLRPLLLLAAGRSCGAEIDELLPAACAVELIHAYSLVHDDLPAFDDDEVRRGQPTNHVVFGEAMAILVGDALQTLAFSCLAEAALAAPEPRPWIRATAELAEASGSLGMAGGQCADLEVNRRTPDPDTLRELYAAKTGALLTASVRIGGLLAGAQEEILTALTSYGRDLGVAFQIVDDVLDVEGELDEIGKRPGGDAHRGQPTLPALVGVDPARTEARRLHDRAVAALEPVDQIEVLVALARLVVERDR